MDGQSGYNHKIAETVKKSCSGALRGIKKIAKRPREVSGCANELRVRYSRVNSQNRQDARDIWLCDNYYVIEKESKQIIKDIRKMIKSADGEAVSRLWNAIDQTLCELMPAICDESISAILLEASKYIELGETEYSMVPLIIKSAFIKLAWKACHESHDEKHIAYAITGFVKLTSVDMDVIVSECSGVEKILMRDPADIYKCMCADSRRYYRYLIAKIARIRGTSENKIALEMLDMANESGDETKKHIGYWITQCPDIAKPKQLRGRISIVCQIILPVFLSTVLSVWLRSLPLFFLCCLPLWEIIRPLVWQVSLAGTDIDYLPRIDPEKITDKPKTVVLVSTLLPKAQYADSLAKRLEQLYFSNSDPDMYFCILADFKECEYPADEQDESQLEASKIVIEELNGRYDGRFMLFLRNRTYNKTQNRYSGWERKRGAITEFIRFLKNEKTSVNIFVGDRSALPKIKFIIALDADTNLLYECAQTMVCAAMHPVNQPVINEHGVVVRGYGILAPKISPDLGSAKATPFSRVLSGCGGVTAYEQRDKDYYQDLFSESVFAGKGLINIDSFYACLNNRFPENQVLSHDILEGAYLRCGFVSDVEMTDSSPANLSSWLSRLHRWLRGDWQNIAFLKKRYSANDREYLNPINALSKYKLFDNLRRSLNCVAAMACLVCALFAKDAPVRLVLALAGILSVCFPSIWAALNALLSGGVFTVSRKFFTRTLPHTLELISQGLILFIMLPAQSVITLDAVLRSLWRTIFSRRKMLEWTTAAQAESRDITVGSVISRFWLPELFGIAYMTLSSGDPLIIVGFMFSLILPIAYYSARPSKEDAHVLGDKDRDTLLSYNAAMWRYYEDFADEVNNYLPPDNIQQSPVFRVANRTSPTNIGLMLLSVLVARDLGFIDNGGLYRRLDRTLSSVERLVTWHGNLYNWYDTCTLDTLKPEFVSCVDSGNFICCLVALKEGLKEFAPKLSGFAGLIKRIEAMINACDLTVFYNERKHLFSIGYEVDSDSLSGSHYDFLMSEARLTSYYAVARKIVDKKHWGSLVRTMSRSGSYAGPVSWTGTMFEYFMPHLLLPVYDGSLLGEALIYCLYCHKKRTKQKGVPWGISESAFYAFDNNLNYQYKAHGVQKLGVKRNLDKELVISPYSTFLTIPLNPNSSMKNLGYLREFGVYGRYGFYEAVDFTTDRVGKNSLAVTRSYMAHHIGMSMVASLNALQDNRMQKRFMEDNYMKSAREFLQEKIAKNTIVYDDLGTGAAQPDREERSRTSEQSSVIFPQSPRCMLLSNGEMTDILTDTGAGYLKFGNVDLTRRGTDVLRHGQGFVAVAKSPSALLPATYAPFFEEGCGYSVERQEQSVIYRAERDNLETSLKCMIHPTISCEQRQYTIKNNSSKNETVDILFYLEPVLCGFSDYNAHPAYSKLFVTSSYDAQTNCLVFKRRNRDATENMFLVVGLLNDASYTFETRREALMRAPEGLRGLLRHCGANLSGSDGGVPDACCAISMRMSVPASSQKNVTVLICAARSRLEGIGSIISMRNIGLLEPKSAARSAVLLDSLEGRVGEALLSQLLWSGPEKENTADRVANRLGQSALWCTGISGDLPITLIERPKDIDGPVLETYIRLHGVLRAFNVEFDLVIFCDSDEEKARLSAAIEQNGSGIMMGVRGGIFLLNRHQLAQEIITLIRALTRHFAIRKDSKTDREFVPYRPVRFLPVSPARMPDDCELDVNGGAFNGGRFYVKKNSPLPWCHVLANGAFGTLVSDSALGFTWAVNSRENKLTPWYNDICSDNTGEICVFSDGGGFFDIVNGSLASFSEKDAVYEGTNGFISSRVTVTVSPSGCAKHIEIVLRNDTEKKREIMCAYYTEPVLGVDRQTARNICPEVMEHDVLVLRNPYNTAASGCMALTAAGDEITEVGFMTGRTAFLSGDWNTRHTAPENDPCAAVIVPLSLPPHRDVGIKFILGYGRTSAAAARMVRPFSEKRKAAKYYYRIKTPDEALNQFINHFAAHQIIASRLNGRCAFYQCGGAYGFRDQLQDAMAYLLIDPGMAKRQILRCCSVQFEEGDVLHWWHDLPTASGGIRGVRTKFSDDLLWLPLAVAEYVSKTGDRGILSLKASYLTAEILGEREHEKYITPERSELREDVFSHCVRALERGFNLGSNGLPLIGCGDWNDGFSSVGLKGRGTSAWLAMFLAHVMKSFSGLCGLAGKDDYAHVCGERAKGLLKTVDEHCWDGRWYVRAFYDDGSAMGTNANDECAIDLLPQSFAVLSGMPDEERVATALESAWERLYDRGLGIVRLFDKPFQHSEQSPGYVKAYPSGLRENGGQYTHSAVWFALALLEHGDYDRGWEILQVINPAYRANDPELSARYMTEPYYMAADIYTNPSAPGRGGWSMYTGAASWYYRVVIENLFGLKLCADKVLFSPKLPSVWDDASLDARIGGTVLHIRINRGTNTGMTCDGKPEEYVPLDGGEHEVIVTVEM